jgi:hypothetical protein
LIRLIEKVDFWHGLKEIVGTLGILNFSYWMIEINGYNNYYDEYLPSSDL